MVVVSRSSANSLSSGSAHKGPVLAVGKMDMFVFFFPFNKSLSNNLIEKKKRRTQCSLSTICPVSVGRRHECGLCTQTYPDVYLTVKAI